MARMPEFRILETPKGYCVSVPACLDGRGKRRRKFFQRREDAEKFASKLRGQFGRGERGGVIPLALAIQAAEAERVLRPAGLTIAEATRQILECQHLLTGTGLSPADACRAAADRHRADGTGETLRQRYRRFTAENEPHWSARYATDMAKLPRWVGEAVMETRCADLSAAAIRVALVANGAAAASTIRARSARVGAVLAAREKNRRIAAEIFILTTGQTRALLRATETPDQRRCLALLLWAGIRPDAESGEISRLDWSAVSASEIYVSAAVSKTKTDRIIPISPRLRRMLAGHPKSGSIRPAQWRRAWQRIRAAAEIGELQDVTRHTFASHFLAAFGEDAALAAMGHAAGSRTLFRHYRRAISREAGLRFFGIREITAPPASP